MQIISPQFVSGKKVLLRLDIDVPIGKSSVISHQSSDQNLVVLEDFRLRAGLPTLKMCLENAQETIVMGHIGRPEGKAVEELSVAPIKQWFEDQGLRSHLTSGKLKLLENLRFDPREEAGDLSFAKELANMGDVFVNEAFASYRPAVSTTILPTLLPHYAGLRFAEEVRVLAGVRNPPTGGSKKPFVAIMGGAKVADKLSVIKVLAEKADAVLVGGKLISEIRTENLSLPKNVLVGMLNEDGFDIAPQTTSAWAGLIRQSRMIVWNGPLGKFEDPKNDATKKIARMVLDSGAQVIIGGGDTISALREYGLLSEVEEKAFSASDSEREDAKADKPSRFISTGGGAMLKFLTDGTLPTIEALS
ncbi:MAG: phosphoglycerate kinase [Candidatus Daviesbacteria bacterium]|nr:phosphoglycerate kinase [Candidatus Daviesbacteria bacterium]